MRFDVCIIGHVTKDLIRIPGRADQQMAGGTAYYTAVALKSLGLDVAVVTKVAEEDESRLLDGLKLRGIRVFNGRTPSTTVFENVYSDPQLSSRRQCVRSIAASFSPEDIQGIDARTFHVGPLTGQETPIEVLAAIREKGADLCLDGQGMLRAVNGGVVELTAWGDAREGLALVDVLKVDDLEAEKLVGDKDPEDAAKALEALGVGEVLVTFADRGSMVVHDGRVSYVPALRPAKPIDATGCGDTYVAGYIFRRLEGADPIDAAWFAAATASLKLERYGAFEEDAEAVRARLKNGQIIRVAPRPVAAAVGRRARAGRR
jgi:sugar/nucleoside kinase (ribokinase family)